MANDFVFRVIPGWTLTFTITLIITSILVIIAPLAQAHTSQEPLNRSFKVTRFQGQLLQRAVITTTSAMSDITCYIECMDLEGCIAVDATCTGLDGCTCDLLADTAFDETELTDVGPGHVHVRPARVVRWPDDSTPSRFEETGVDPLQTPSARFSVKGCQKVRLYLSKRPLAEGPTYEIMIGDFDGSHSVIRPGLVDKTEDHLQVETPNILSCNEYRRFWISWDNNTVQVGYGWSVHERIFLSRQDLDNFHDIRYFTFKGYGKNLELFFMFLET